MDEGDRTDEWTTVKRRSSSRNAPQSRIGSKISISEEQMRKQQRKNAKAVSGIVDSCCKIDSDFDLDSTHKEIVNDLIPKLQESAFLRCCLSHLRSYSYNRIVAFGIGRCNNSSSKLQTAFLCCLVKNLLDRSPELASANSSGICTVIDPIYSEKDEALCAMLGLTVERTNTKGKLSLEKTAIRTLYFMPHCPYRLYCNVVWSHRNHPDQPIILGNSFDSYYIRRIGREDAADVLRLAQGSFTEQALWQRSHANDPIYGLENAFIETSLIRLIPCNAASVAWPGEEEIDKTSAVDLELA